MPQPPSSDAAVANAASALNKLFDTQVDASVYQALRRWLSEPERQLGTITCSDLATQLDEWHAAAEQSMKSVRELVGC